MKRKFVAVLLVAALALSLMPLGKAEAAVRTGRTAGISEKVTITSSTADKMVTVGSTVQFSVVATGKGKLTYQWQAKTPTGDWKNSAAPSAKTKDLSFTAQVAHNACQFRCIVYDEDGSTVTTNPVKLYVKAAITTQPKAQTVSVGGTAKFTVVANGKLPISYQWQAKSPTGDWKNSSSASAKTASLSVTAQSGHNGYLFRCIVTDGNGNKTVSSNAKLTVTSAATGVTITSQPSAKTVSVGSTATFSVGATGNGTLSYQWQAKSPTGDWKNSSAPSAKTASLSLTAQTGHNGYLFRCIVTDSKGNKATSNSAKLTVSTTASGVTITYQPTPTAVPVGSTASFSVKATGNGTLTFQWQAYNPSTKKWVNSGSDSAKKPVFSLTAQVGHNDYKFRCIVQDSKGNTKTTDAVTLTVNPAVSAYTMEAQVIEGGTAQFNVSAVGKATLTYQWQAKSPTGDWKNSSSPSAKTAQLKITAQKGHNGFLFRCVITDGNGNKTTSNPAKLIVLAAQGITIDESHFPNATFRTYLKNLSVGKDGVLSDEDIASITEINVENMGIDSLTGIAYLTALERLECGGNYLHSLSVQSNKKLTYLDCHDNEITKLDVNSNNKLVYLDCSHNDLNSLKLDQALELQTIYCSYNNLLSLDLGENENLEILKCDNNAITQLYAEQCSALQELWIDGIVYDFNAPWECQVYVDGMAAAG